MWEQCKACEEGAEIIVCTPVSVTCFPHLQCSRVLSLAAGLAGQMSNNRDEIFLL